MAEESTLQGEGEAPDTPKAGFEALSARRVVLGALERASRRPRPKRRRIDAASPQELTVLDPVSEILHCAEELNIPWKRILVDEIQAERRLRRGLGEIERGCSLRPLLRLLAASSLRSWRARDQIERLSREARKASTHDAVRELHFVFSELSGRGE